MFDCLVIFSKTGNVLYWYHPQQQQQEVGPPAPVELVNQFIEVAFLSEKTSSNSKNKKNQCAFQVLPSANTSSSSSSSSSSNNNMLSSGNCWMVAEWEEGGPNDYDIFYRGKENKTKNSATTSRSKDWIAVIFYKQILQNRIAKLSPLLLATLHEFAIFHASVIKSKQQQKQLTEYQQWMQHIPPPNKCLFDPTFVALCRKLEQQQQENANNDNISNIPPADSLTTKKSTSSNTSSKKQPGYNGIPTKKASSQVIDSLDRSKKISGETTDMTLDRELQEARAAYLPTESELLQEQDRNDNNPVQLFFGLTTEELQDDGDTTTIKKSRLYGFWEHVTGNKILTKEDVQPIAHELTQILTSKNVAHETAQLLMEDVQRSLIGYRMSSMTRVKTVVRQTLEKSIDKILSSSKRIDLLSQVLSKKNNKNNTKPFVIVFVGINGVGKSTSLAKIAYYLKSSGCSPMIAACDTFRSGAVEQLNVHAQCLEVPLYQRGYAKDPSAVARAAVAQATADNHDVVLVDTAGRMQNNVPLMNALGKLVVENQPDLVLFVAEALVGNDGMDQLRLFDKAISGRIDGIILTKFDTVSEKVGAALTMSHLTGKPVLFVGTGQKYNHLKRLNAQAVIQSLFS